MAESPALPTGFPRVKIYDQIGLLGRTGKFTTSDNVKTPTLLATLRLPESDKWRKRLRHSPESKSRLEWRRRNRADFVAATTAQAAPPQQIPPGAPLAQVPVDALGIPQVVLDAYMRAGQTMVTNAPRCGLQWSVLAGIGRAESNTPWGLCSSFSSTWLKWGKRRPGQRRALFWRLECQIIGQRLRPVRSFSDQRERLTGGTVALPVYYGPCRRPDRGACSPHLANRPVR